MNISRIFILRPIATSLLMAALLLSGLLAYRYLPIGLSISRSAMNWMV